MASKPPKGIMRNFARESRRAGLALAFLPLEALCARERRFCAFLALRALSCSS